jgi:hypothetical protein
MPEQVGMDVPGNAHPVTLPLRDLVYAARSEERAAPRLFFGTHLPPGGQDNFVYSQLCEMIK